MPPLKPIGHRIHESIHPAVQDKGTNGAAAVVEHLPSRCSIFLLIRMPHAGGVKIAGHLTLLVRLAIPTAVLSAPDRDIRRPVDAALPVARYRLIQSHRISLDPDPAIFPMPRYYHGYRNPTSRDPFDTIFCPRIRIAAWIAASIPAWIPALIATTIRSAKTTAIGSIIAVIAAVSIVGRANRSRRNGRQGETE